MVGEVSLMEATKGIGRGSPSCLSPRAVEKTAEREGRVSPRFLRSSSTPEAQLLVLDSGERRLSCKDVVCAGFWVVVTVCHRAHRQQQPHISPGIQESEGFTCFVGKLTTQTFTRFPDTEARQTISEG